MRRNKVFAAVSCLCMMMMMQGCSNKPSQEQQQTMVRPVKTMTIVEQPVVRDRILSGISQSKTSSKLSFRVSGTITALPAKVGDKVKKDQKLAELDPADFKLQLDEATAAYKASEAQLKRVQELYEGGNASKQELDDVWARRDGDFSKMELLQKQLSYTTLVSPADGYISSVAAEVNETVAQGQPVCTLEQEGDIDVMVGLPDSLIHAIKQNDQAEVSFASIPGGLYAAEVAEIGVTTDVVTRTFPVKLRLLNLDPRVKPGLTCDVRFSIHEQRDSGGIYIPTDAVKEDEKGKKFIWIYDDATSCVKAREIVLGQVTERGFQVLSGVSVGDIIVIAGVHYLEEGQKVRLMDDKTT